MFTSADLSIIIPSFNSSATVEACLNALFAQLDPPGEIILVDSSNDQTPRLVKERFPLVKVHTFEHRTFPGVARNLGASIAAGSILGFIDADCIAVPDWTRRMVAEHNAGHLIVGGSIEVGNQRCAVAWAGHIMEFRDFIPHGSPRRMLHVPSCNISYRKVLFERAGGFSNAYYPQEDLLFNYLLNQHGVPVWFDPEISVRHHCRELLRDFIDHQHRFGRVTRNTLARINLQGSSFARHPLIAVISAPFLGVVKIIRNSYVLLRHFPAQIFRHPQLPLLLVLGAMWWTRGFIAGAQTGLSGIRGWNNPNEKLVDTIDLTGLDLPVVAAPQDVTP